MKPSRVISFDMCTFSQVRLDELSHFFGACEMVGRTCTLIPGRVRSFTASGLLIHIVSHCKTPLVTSYFFPRTAVSHKDMEGPPDGFRGSAGKLWVTEDGEKFCEVASSKGFDGFRRASTSSNYSPIPMLPSPAPGGVLADSLPGSCPTSRNLVKFPEDPA